MGYTGGYGLGCVCKLVGETVAGSGPVWMIPRGHITQYLHIDGSVLHTQCLSSTVTTHLLLPTAREGNVFTGVCLSTIGLMANSSLLGLVTTQSVRILTGMLSCSHKSSLKRPVPFGNVLEICSFFGKCACVENLRTSKLCSIF